MSKFKDFHLSWVHVLNFVLLKNIRAPMAFDFIRSVLKVDLIVKMFLTLIKEYSKYYKIGNLTQGTLSEYRFYYI